MFILRTIVTALAASMTGLIAAHGYAPSLTLYLLDQNGEGVSSAVVTLHALDGQHSTVTPAANLQVVQRDLQFDPGLLIAPVGSEVSFPNEDNTGHHVYSFSPAKMFDLRLIAGGRSESVLFDQVGSVAIGCNIHDDMVGFIHVVDTPWAALSDITGLVHIPRVPSGRYQLRIWHERLDARNKTFEEEIELSDMRPALDYHLDLRRARQSRGRY